ncbi:WD40-repeat-containing domain protein [Gautieria morchelliformis]|nr:WD40-repeat-containing domain protein [Gautieria morchelliformis]
MMKDQLCFNICQLETSRLHNDDIVDLATWTKKYISPQLSYSCHFWADHVHATTLTPGIGAKVKVFFETKLLYWLEALSLIEKVFDALAKLWSIRDWSQDNDTRAFIWDTRKIVATFMYLPEFPRLLRIETGKLEMWSAIKNVLVGHNLGVSSLPFSPNGKRIVSGSHDLTIRVWDADTVELLSAPFEGHTSYAMSVAFSQDGKQIVSRSGDQTIHVWNADTRELLSAPFEDHTNRVMSVVFSHDGKRIVSGSSDQTIRVWNADTGEGISAPFEGHASYVTSVTFSQDGKQIVSGSGDNTIRVWNADTGELLSAPFEGHTDWGMSVTFTQDGKQIVSGSYDKTIRVWNADTGELISASFTGHISYVTSVAFSPDGKRIISGSLDTIEGDTTSSCKKCRFYINWSMKFRTATRTRDYSDECWVTLPFVYNLPPAEQRSVPSTHRPLRRAHKATARISTAGKPPQVTPSEQHWLSLSPMLSTSSVEAYIMSTDRTPLQGFPPVPCPFLASPMASVASTSSTPSPGGSHTSGPDCASTSSAATHTEIYTGHGPDSRYGLFDTRTPMPETEPGPSIPSNAHTQDPKQGLFDTRTPMPETEPGPSIPSNAHTQDPKQGLFDTWTPMCETEPGPSIP